jgi:crossover junction endodeoxyribonuclease RuvC
VLILGIDPGTVAAGYGVIHRDGSKLEMRDAGVVTASRRFSLPERLQIIHQGLSEAIARSGPDVAVVETPFVSKNPATAIAIGEARGVALLACVSAGLQIEEFSPAEIKRAVIGNGAARKEQVALMVKSILRLSEMPQPHDATDALAAAICYAHRASFSEKLGAVEQNRKSGKRPPWKL